VFAVDCVASATGSKLFGDRIVADIGRSYGGSNQRMGGSQLEGRSLSTLTIGWRDAIKLTLHLDHPVGLITGTQAAMMICVQSHGRGG
jgi:hypothetical protein